VDGASIVAIARPGAALNVSQDVVQELDGTAKQLDDPGCPLSPRRCARMASGIGEWLEAHPGRFCGLDGFRREALRTSAMASNAVSRIIVTDEISGQALRLFVPDFHGTRPNAVRSKQVLDLGVLRVLGGSFDWHAAGIKAAC
jgi:hypothetical protein